MTQRNPSTFIEGTTHKTRDEKVKKHKYHEESMHNARAIFLWDTPLGEVAQPTHTHCQVTLVSALSGLAQL